MSDPLLETMIALINAIMGREVVRLVPGKDKEPEPEWSKVRSPIERLKDRWISYPEYARLTLRTRQRPIE